jgi:RHS repeat-associated protein
MGTKAFSAPGRVISSLGLTYGSFGREVEIASGSTYTQVLYGPIGKLGLMNGQNTVSIRTPLPGGGTEEILPTAVHILHADWLGSAGLSTLFTGRSVANYTQYAPYGESEDSSTDLDFTGQFQDTLSGLYDFQYRGYSPAQSRWLNPDPAGLGAADPSNPQTWNRYAYVLNKPLGYIDPTGLDCVRDNGDGTTTTYTDDQDNCEGDNGFYFDGTVTQAAIDANGNALASVNGQFQCAGDTGCSIYNNLTSITVNGGSAPQVYVPFSLISPSVLQTQPTNNLPSITAGPPQPAPLKQGCTGPALSAGARAAINDAFGPPGSPADALTDKNVQRAAVGTLYVAANSAKSLAPALDFAADLVPVAGQALAVYQGGSALYAGGKAYKASIDQCYQKP